MLTSYASASLLLRRHSALLLSSTLMLCMLTISSTPSLADDASSEKTGEKTPLVTGPAKIPLGNKLATIDLPKGFCFLPEKETKQILQQQGNSVDGVLGLMVPAPDKNSKDDESKDDNNFAVICTYADCGYVTDDDANKIDSNDLLKQIKEATKEGNKEREEKKVPPYFAGNWAEKPHYDKGSHSIIWAIEVVDQDTPTAVATDVNYNTRILGRQGVLSMDLITKASKLEVNKKRIAELLKSTTFVPGLSYADHKGGDKSAGFGIAGLILGGGAVAAAAKFGVFAGLWKFLLAGLLILKKFAIIGIVALGGLFRKFFGKKNQGQGVAAAPPPATGPVPPSNIEPPL